MVLKVNGAPRHKCHHGRWDMLMGLVAKAVNKLIQLACRKKKNYIIDQTNCTLAGRRRKMTPFREFQRKAVVLVPSEEEFANRRVRQVQETGREIPAEAMLELKATFILPVFDDGYFDDIIYVEPLGGVEDAQKMVDRYNEEGKAWRPFEKQKFGPRGQSNAVRKRRPTESKADGDGNGPPAKIAKGKESSDSNYASRNNSNTTSSVRVGFGQVINIRSIDIGGL